MKKKKKLRKHFFALFFSCSLSLARSPAQFSSLSFRNPMTADRAAAFKAALGQLNSQFAR